jgi:chemotaxis protein methyltransferase WspC
MNVREVADLLQTRIGADPLSLGSNTLSNIVAKRMHALGLTDPHSYSVHLKGSAEEFAELTAEVVVPETWFFRGGKLFAFLAEHVQRATLSASPPSTFHILSAPCSSGEEPYSMVIALLEAGIPRERWTVAGVDLSTRSLAKASEGVYRESSFRETPAHIRRKYFHESHGGWECDPAVRDRAQFRAGNLVDPDLLSGAGPFDLIFCRNLLIYLHAEARRRVLANLDRLLAPRGLLCMGHAEPLNLFDRRFQATGPDAYFLFQRQGEHTRSRGVATNATLDLPRKLPRTKTLAPRRPHTPSVPAAHSPAAASVDLLEKARREADAGSLGEALQTCQAHLANARPSAHGYSLLGVIHQARREKIKAAECFRRALYLDPQHEEALLHLLLLYQEDGNEAAAMRLRRRLERKVTGGEA